MSSETDTGAATRRSLPDMVSPNNGATPHSVRRVSFGPGQAKIWESPEASHLAPEEANGGPEFSPLPSPPSTSVSLADPDPEVKSSRIKLGPIIEGMQTYVRERFASFDADETKESPRASVMSRYSTFSEPSGRERSRTAEEEQALALLENLRMQVGGLREDGTIKSPTSSRRSSRSTSEDDR